MITIIYYTSNREDERFEGKIREALVASSKGIPLISVSQKPIDFGHNICVGDIGVSDLNILHQLLVGCEAADTPLVAHAESDCLYPPEGHFDFVPDKIDWVYRNTNLWLFDKRWVHFRKKAYSLCNQIAGREYLIDRLKRKLDEGPNARGDIVHKKGGWSAFESAIPCINIKTENGMRRKAGSVRGMDPVKWLPHWGEAKELGRTLFEAV